MYRRKGSTHFPVPKYINGVTVGGCNMENKNCDICGVFIENAYSYQKYCADCAIQKNKESKQKHYLRNKEKRRELNRNLSFEEKEELRKKKREYYHKNIEKMREIDRERRKWEKPYRNKRDKERYYKKRVEILQYHREYYQTNKEDVKSRVRQWSSENKDKVRELSRIKRVRKSKAHGSHSTNDFYKVCKDFKWECAYCGGHLEKRTATEDHVIPLSKGGSDLINNIIPACRMCNSTKSAQGLFEWYPKQAFYSKEREQKITNRITNGTSRLALF